METLVKVRDLHKVYYRGSEQIDVLQGIYARHTLG